MNENPDGSSPRVQGTVDLALQLLGLLRFIPAGAGNRACSMSMTATTTVHPRGCGEQLPAVMPLGRGAGSSPRVRGTAAHQPEGHLQFRFIPAGAGNSAGYSVGDRVVTVHPRGCGEQFCGVA